MKKKLLQAALLPFLSVIWLFPFAMLPRQWGFTAGMCAALLCLILLPQRVAAFGAAAAIALGMSIFDRTFFVCFAPPLLACGTLFAALTGSGSVPVKKDGVFLTSLIAAALGMLGGLPMLLFGFDAAVLNRPAFTRHCAAAVAAVAVSAGLLALCVRRNRAESAGRRKKTLFIYDKLTAAFAVLLAAQVLSAAGALRLGATAGHGLFPLFASAYYALTAALPATDLALRRGAGRN